jgi:hypothetical protein
VPDGECAHSVPITTQRTITGLHGREDRTASNSYKLLTRRAILFSALPLRSAGPKGHSSQLTVTSLKSLNAFLGCHKPLRSQ